MGFLISNETTAMFKLWSRHKPGSDDAPEPPSDLRCSFCRKRQGDVPKLIAGPSVFICNECVDVCVAIIAVDERCRHTRESVSGQAPSAAESQSSAGVACSLCGQEFQPELLLAIRERVMLCGTCADAVEDALARGRPVPG